MNDKKSLDQIIAELKVLLTLAYAFTHDIEQAQKFSDALALVDSVYIADDKKENEE